MGNINENITLYIIRKCVLVESGMRSSCQFYYNSVNRLGPVVANRSTVGQGSFDCEIGQGVTDASNYWQLRHGPIFGCTTRPTLVHQAEATERSPRCIA
jgi:hypothetical protein